MGHHARMAWYSTLHKTILPKHGHCIASLLYVVCAPLWKPCLGHLFPTSKTALHQTAMVDASKATCQQLGLGSIELGLEQIIMLISKTFLKPTIAPAPHHHHSD